MAKTCPDCNGSGKIVDHSKPLIKDTNVRGYWQYKTCTRCAGTGKIYTDEKSGCMIILPLIGMATAIAAVAVERLA